VCAHVRIRMYARTCERIIQVSCDIVTSIYLQTIQMIVILCHIYCHIPSQGVTLLSRLERSRVVGSGAA